MIRQPAWRRIWRSDETLLRLALIGTAALLGVGQTSAGETRTIDLNGHTFTLAADLEIELVAGPPLVERPITADFDELGRLYVSDSSGSNDKVEKQLAEKPHKILRLEDSDRDGTFDRRTVFADKMMFPEGTLWFDGSLYVTAPPSIWKLTDVDGDGVAEKREEWFQAATLTGCANDLHGPYLGRDGWIYWCKGAFAQQTYERPGKSPFVTKASHIFRCRPDAPRDPKTGSVLTSAIESVMTGGMDNPVDVVFTPTGERIFTTTFLVNPGGGQRDGLIHAIYGGVYGKQHGVLDGHPRTGELMPTLVHQGPSAPCGLVHYENSRLGTEYEGNLFACCFNMHKLTRHVLREEAAGLSATNEDLLDSSNVDFHPTDVIEDADGSLIVCDTGGWYKLCCPTSQLWKPDVLGGVYRIRRRSDGRSKNGVDDPRGLHLSWDRLSPSSLVELLEDRRPAVRERTTRQLAKLGAEAVSAVVAAPAATSVETRQKRLWTLTRIDHRAAREAVRAGLNDSESSVRQVALQSISLWRDREALPKLRSLLGTDSAEARLAAEAIGRIGDAESVEAILSAAGSAKSRAMEHALIYALIEIGSADAIRHGIESVSPDVQRIAAISLDQLDPASISSERVITWLTSPDAGTRRSAEWLLGRHPEWGGALADDLRERLRSEQSPADTERLRNLLVLFSSHPKVQELLGTTLADRDALPASRLLAADVIRRSSVKEIPPEWVAATAAALADSNRELVAATVAAARALPVSKTELVEWNSRLREIAANSKFDEATRLDALAALTGEKLSLTPESFGFVSSHLSPEQSVTSRAAAIRILGRSTLTAEQLTELTSLFGTVGPLEAPRLLDTFAQSTDEAVGRLLIASLKASPAIASLRVDQVRQVLAKYSPEIQRDGETLAELINVDLARQKDQIEEMLKKVPEGDLRRGFAVFRSSKAACATCHQMGYVGGNIGPDLSKIGQIRTERDILEAMLFPNASFVRSYEPVVLALMDGRVENGVIKDETATEVVLVKNATETLRIARSEIEELRPSGVSIMPAGFGQQLSQQDLVDLVVFLKSLK
jgi:putative membrane-bound dehydrogenase-like protein